MKLFTPQMTEICEVDRENLQEYLVSNGLADRQVVHGDGSLIVFDQRYADVLNNVENGHITTLTRYSSIDKLANEVAALLDESDAVAFVPDHRAMRLFFNTEGFVSEMNSLTNQFAHLSFVLPAGLYGRSHVAVFVKGA